MMAAGCDSPKEKVEGWSWVVLAAIIPIIVSDCEAPWFCMKGVSHAIHPLFNSAINNSIFGTFSLLFGGLLEAKGSNAALTAWIFNIGTAFWSISCECQINRRKIKFVADVLDILFVSIVGGALVKHTHRQGCVGCCWRDDCHRSFLVSHDYSSLATVHCIFGPSWWVPLN